MANGGGASRIKIITINIVSKIGFAFYLAADGIGLPHPELQRSSDYIQLIHKLVDLLNNKIRGFQNWADLRYFFDSFGAIGTDPYLTSCSIVFQDSIVNEKPENKPKEGAKSSHLAPGVDCGNSAQMTEIRLADLLDNTLWNRKLAPSYERIV